MMNAPDLASAGLDHNAAKRDLAIAAHCHTIAATHRQDRRAVILFHEYFLSS